MESYIMDSLTALIQNIQSITKYGLTQTGQVPCKGSAAIKIKLSIIYYT